MIGLKLKSFAKYISTPFVVQGVTVKAWAGVDYKFVTGPASAAATVVVSSANSQQAGHDPLTVEGDGADTKGVLHTCPDSDARNMKSPTVNCEHGSGLLRSSV